MNANNSVRANLTTGRERATVENKEFAAFARRIVRAFARRVAQGDIEALTDLLAFAADIDDALQDAVTGLREYGYSWSEIAKRAGTKKQTAYERWAAKRTTASEAEVNASHVVCTVQLSLVAEPAGGEL
ncbi:MAG TPA: hypothetical protein VFC19_13360 [Candidatus Limnocylindrales bacterium]|nr:hypothetical protein [Candidatus Limnocylindrales bacterium]